MDDLISRQAALNEIAEWMLEYGALNEKRERDALQHVARGIKKLPSVQPERPKGEWIPVDSYSAFGGDEATWMAHGNPVAFYYCSECKEQAYAGEDGEPLITDYCPNCGADMKGEQNAVN